jgi:hypothetical protein
MILFISGKFKFFSLLHTVYGPAIAISFTGRWTEKLNE